MTETKPNELGYKILTADNWRDTDPIWKVFGDFAVHPSPQRQWVEEVLAINLAPHVPVQLRKLFEIARASLIYALYFYPLLTLGTEQLFRVHEAAARIRCQMANAPEKETRNFDGQIKWLIGAGLIAGRDDDKRWHAVRQLRNSTSHPKDQNIFDPNMALTMLEGAAEKINELFA